MIPTDAVPPSKSTHKRKGRGKNRRRLSRELALQGIYQWHLAGGNAAEIDLQLQQVNFYGKADGAYFSELLQGALQHGTELETQIQLHLDRHLAELSPVEYSILLIGTYEMMHRPEIPYRAIIIEAIELAKCYGGTYSHKYVNGVLDKLAAQLRTVEFQHALSMRKSY